MSVKSGPIVQNIGRTLRSKRGSMLVEFAFVAPFVVLLLTATAELAVTLFVEVTIGGAVQSAARDIRTGQIQENQDPLDAFQTKLCDSLFGIVNCASVTFDVRTFDDFDSVEMTIEVDEEGNLSNGQFTPGDAGEITVVRAAYRWNFMTPLVGKVLSADGSGGILLVSTTAFQNELYELGG
tara:strand:+ start:87 stop:629 length:543 start_codon:yes stop_codon:yes gene_type:complete